MAYPYQTYLPSQGMQQMPYQQPMMQQPMPQQMAQPPAPIVRPVASLDEARAVQTDFGGALTIMPDISHGFVYTKQLNFQTGSADFAAYQRVQEQVAPQQDINLSEYVKRSDFDELARRFNALCDQLGGTTNEHGSNAHAGADGK
nr:MAG TPA: hypothetical protein [Caudoviricetes sp.]